MSSHLLVFQLSGGPPYGLRLQGGFNESAFVIAKIRPASKAEAVGLQEGDVVVAVNGIRCRGLTHNTTTALMDLHPHVLTIHVIRGGGQFDVEAGEQTMGSQLAVLSEAEAALLVARQPSSSPSVTNMVSPSSSQMLQNSPALLLQQPPFKLRGINKMTPSVGISTDQQLPSEYDAETVRPTTTYSRNEQTVNDDDGRTHTVEERETKTYSGGDGGSLSRTTTTARRQMVSYSHTGDLQQQPPQPWQQATFKDETTDADDWYGEQTEDKAHYSVVREARPYDRGRQRGKVEAASVSDSTSDVRRQHAVDHVYSEPFRPQIYHVEPELADSKQQAAAVHVVHTGGPRSTLHGQAHDDATKYYEADIRPGQSVVMPGFTISIEAGRGPQQDGLRSSQPVVTVTPAEGDGHLMTISEQDFLPRHRQDQQHYHQQQQQQQPTSEHHPLAGVMKGQHTRQQVGADRSLYRESDRSLEQDVANDMRPQGRPASSPHQQPPAAWRAEAIEHERPSVDNRAWQPDSDVFGGGGRYASVTETRPAIDNVQVSVGDQPYFSVKSPPRPPTSISANAVQPEPQAQPHQVPPQQPLLYQSQSGGQQPHQMPQSGPQKQSLPYHGQYGGPQPYQVPQSSPPQQPLPYQGQIGGPHQMPQSGPQKRPLPYHVQDGGPQPYYVPQSSQPQQPLPYQGQIGRPQPHQMSQSGPQIQSLSYHAQDEGPQPYQVPQSSPPQQPLPYQSQIGGQQPYQMPQSGQQKQPLPYHAQVGGPQSTAQYQAQPYQSQVRQPSLNQPSHQSQPPAHQLPVQRFEQQASYGTASQRPQNFVSHKLPMNPNFNRALLEDSQPQPQDAQTLDGTDLSAQNLTERYPADYGEVEFGASATVPTWNQPTANTNYSATTWQEEYGEAEGGRYSGKAMYMEENGGYHSLPRTSNRPGAAVEPPVPPPPPPPDPFKIYGITAAGGDPERRNLQQKVMLANSVAQSFTSTDNANSRGQRMFLLRRQHSEKWTTAGPDPPRDVTDHQQQWAGGGAWPQRAPAGRQHYITGQPALARQLSAPQHHLPSGPRPGRSTSMEGPSPLQHHHGQFLPGPGPGPQQQGFLRHARPLGPMAGRDGTGAPVLQVRHRSESFGSLPGVVRPAAGDWHASASQQQRDRHLSGGQQHPQQTRHWPASSPSSSQPLIAVSGHYGVSDL